VRQGERACLVDEQGVYLPLRVPVRRIGEFASTRPSSPCIFLLEGVGQPPPAVGQIWPGQDLQSGLRLASLLTHCVWREQIRAISLVNHGGRQSPAEPHVRLLLDGSEVRWGRGPGEEMGVEIPAAQKIALLQGLYAEHGRLDAGRTHVDVRFSRTDVGVPDG
jgi:hypothetical protein